MLLLVVEILIVAGAYLLGAIPFGLILAKTVKGVDVRDLGSGNIGATNVARTSGKALGIVTLVLDAIKGAAPVLVAQEALRASLEVTALAGLAAILGHVFPIYLRFRGGKGVATSLGVFVALTPIPTLIALGVFLVVFAAFRIVSVGSLVAALALIAAVSFWDKRPPVIAVTVLVALLIVFRHRSNLARIIKKAENKL